MDRTRDGRATKAYHLVLPRTPRVLFLDVLGYFAVLPTTTVLQWQLGERFLTKHILGKVAVINEPLDALMQCMAHVKVTVGIPCT